MDASHVSRILQAQKKKTNKKKIYFHVDKLKCQTKSSTKAKINQSAKMKNKMKTNKKETYPDLTAITSPSRELVALNGKHRMSRLSEAAQTRPQISQSGLLVHSRTNCGVTDLYQIRQKKDRRKRRT